MTHADFGLPSGFVVRLHDEVQVGEPLVAGTRILKLSAAAQRLLASREVTVSSPITNTLADRLLDLDLADPVVTAWPGRLDDLTVVVPVRDNSTGVGRLLRGLLGVRCIVVDDASYDPEALARVVTGHGAQLIRLHRNEGPGAARNAALNVVETAFVAFVDSDVTVSTKSLEDLTRHFADPRLAAVAPRITTPPGGRWFQRFEAACGSLDLGPVSATVRPLSPVTYVPSACLIARTDALGQGFDPHLRTGEDVDLIWRLHASGRRVRYAADVVAQHDARDSVHAWLARKSFYGTSAAPLARRHGQRAAPAVLSAPVVAAAVGVLVQRRWSLAIAAVGAMTFVWRTTSDLADVPLEQKASHVLATGGVMTGQVSGLALRHWWPLSLLLALASSRARRALTAAAVVDGLIAHRSARVDLDPVRFIIARRADDLAYGAGVWRGALTERSLRCLVPRWVSPPRAKGDA